MRYSLAAIAALAGAVSASPAPAATATGAASTCSGSYSGVFEIQVVNVTTSKRDLEKRADPLKLTLSGGVLKDALGRIGYIASNRQFQFDYEAQPGSVYEAGWAVCSNNNTLVLGKDAIFQQCLSGTFYNLYDEATAAQCSPVYIDVVTTGGAAASQIGDGQVTASAVASQITDGQIQATPVSPVTQISDGQIQGPTGVVSQISDGQIQQPTGVVSQISDGQIQQPVKTSGPVVTQITDGQIQAPTGSAAPTTTRRVVSQISDGQPQVPTNGTTPQRPASATVQAYTGAASLPTAAVEMIIAAGALAAAML